MKLPVAAGLATAAVTITLYPLFQGQAWFWACAGAVLVTTATGVLLSRLAPRGRASSPWMTSHVMAAALAIYLTAAFAGDQAWLRVIPTKDSVLRLFFLLVEGFDDIQRYAAPVPADPGVSLLTAGGVGLIAISVDLLAVRLRRAATAGLPMLALFTVPAAVMTDPIGWPAFVIGAFGYVGLLVADGRERLSHWGRAVIVRRSRLTPGGGMPPDTGRLALSGKRIGVMAVALAILVPGLLPTLSPDPLFGFGVGNGSGAGGGTIGVPDAMVKLGGQLRQPENEPVLTYTTSDGRSRYLRIYSLDRFDGATWRVGTLQGRREDRVSAGPLPPPPGLDPGIATRRMETRISISEDISRLNFLPLPYPPAQVDVDGDWRADRSSLLVFSTEDEAAGLSYRVVVDEPEPTNEQLRLTPAVDPDVDSPYLELPAALDPEIHELALEVTRRAATPYEKAVKLQEWFTRTGGFTYSLDVGGGGPAVLTDFLLATRMGYCEHFAGAMAVMARSLGIPARVATGYTGGTRTGDAWTVRTHDSHAWPELYFDGVGWLRFEPTPGGSGGQGTAQTPQYTLPVAPTTAPTSGSSGDSAAETEETDDAAAPVRPDQRGADRDVDGSPVPAASGPPTAAKVAAGLAVALLLALTPAGIRGMVRLRRRRALAAAAVAPAPAVEAAWAELCDTLTDLGLAREPGESPRALGKRLTDRHGLDGEEAESVVRIVTAQERLRYARTPGDAIPGHADLARVRRGLTRGASPRRRLAVGLAPMSTLLRIRALGGRALEVFDLSLARR
ncbi:transglutaminase TgpA family protein [Sphaerimonospora sp. CA-214678]|uniref:transglutaminase TgpA family protein n=1 Tax=Sphaerimonospora sp. CA-214678 TaxID=3240029 RepID=UPI003D8F1055